MTTVIRTVTVSLMTKPDHLGCPLNGHNDVPHHHGLWYHVMAATVKLAINEASTLVYVRHLNELLAVIAVHVNGGI